MNSWAVSACYPRSTFYPLSDGPSIQNHRITKTYFRTCLIRRSCSQARLCLCTQCAMSDRAERTFVLLRYALGGDRSEERRVGKEGRSRWSPDHYKKREEKSRVA